MALVFAASSDGVASLVQTLSDDNFSVAFWLYRTATPGVQANIVGTDITTTSWGIYLTPANLIEADFQFSTTPKARNSATVPPLNTWIHVIVVHQNTGLASTDFTFYFDGISEAGTNISSGVGTHDRTALLQLGINNQISISAAPCNIGSLALWSRAISSSEALAIAKGAHPTRFREGLQEFYALDRYVDTGFFGTDTLIPVNPPGTTTIPGFIVSPPIEPPVIWPQIARF